MRCLQDFAGSTDVCVSAAYSHNVPLLPFELQVLELALGDICQMCSNLGKELDGIAFPALDELMKHVSTGRLGTTAAHAPWHAQQILLRHIQMLASGK